ncbi:MAG: hypothetical protein JRI68_29705 [Deltaproteobacteria bacterium]|nr:hypothetical protein [Deltaproteobacteria bacterium]
MFRIRSAQMDRLGASTRERFVAMMCDYLRKYFPRWVGGLDEPGLTAWVAAALDKADRYGVRTEPEAAQLIVLFIVIGLDADETKPWAEEILADDSLVALGKVRALVRLAREHEIAGVEQALVFPEMEG